AHARCRPRDDALAKGLAVRKLLLRADDTSIEGTGQISDLAGPAGELSLRASALNFDRLLVFASDFAAGAASRSGQATPASAKGTAAAVPSAMNLAVSLDATRATIGTLALDTLSGRAR